MDDRRAAGVRYTAAQRRAIQTGEVGMRRHTDYAAWRGEVVELNGWGCVVATGGWTPAVGDGGGDCEGPMEAHHLIFGSGRPKYEVANGLPLCRLHHQQAHSGWLKIRPEWLSPAATLWLADQGYVAWDADGKPYGRKWKVFDERRGR